MHPSLRFVTSLQRQRLCSESRTFGLVRSSQGCSRSAGLNQSFCHLHSTTMPCRELDHITDRIAQLENAVFFLTDYHHYQSSWTSPPTHPRFCRAVYLALQPSLSWLLAWDWIALWRVCSLRKARMWGPQSLAEEIPKELSTSGAEYCDGVVAFDGRSPR